MYLLHPAQAPGYEAPCNCSGDAPRGDRTKTALLALAWLFALLELHREVPPPKPLACSSAGSMPRERLCVARVFLCLSSPTWPGQPLQAVSSRCKIEHPSSCTLLCQPLSSCSLAQSWRSTELSGSHHCCSPWSLSPAPGRLSPPRDTLATSGRPRLIWGRWQQKGGKP